MVDQIGSRPALNKAQADAARHERSRKEAKCTIDEFSYVVIMTGVVCPE